MGRPTQARSLAVWMNGEPVGTWSLPAGIEATTLSGNAVESWFDNLLPDSDAIRRRAQTRFQAASTSAFDLLSAIVPAPCSCSRQARNPAASIALRPGL